MDRPLRLELSTEEEVVASMHIDIIRYHLICFCFVYYICLFIIYILVISETVNLQVNYQK